MNLPLETANIPSETTRCKKYFYWPEYGNYRIFCIQIWHASTKRLQNSRIQTAIFCIQIFLKGWKRGFFGNVGEEMVSK